MSEPSSEDEWLTDKERLRYKSAHRKMDVALVKRLWPSSSTDPTTIHVKDTSRGVQKKYKKIVRAHKSNWVEIKRQQTDLSKHFPPNYAAILEMSEKIRESMRSLIPKVDGKTVVDVSEGIRIASSNEWKSQDAAGITIQGFWIVAHGTYCKLELEDYLGCIEDATTLLNLFPPLSDTNPIPNPYEVVVLSYRAKAYSSLRGTLDDNLKMALNDSRCCAAAARLLMYHREEWSPREMRLLEKNVKYMALNTIHVAAKLKVQERAHRPFFSVGEINEYEKELGIGIFSRRKYKCQKCGVSRDSARLQLCSGCHRVWYCSQECQQECWAEHREWCKDKWRRKGLLMDLGSAESTKQVLREEGERSLYVDTRRLKYRVVDDDSLLVVSIDPDTNELFDAWTDRPIVGSADDEDN